MTTEVALGLGLAALVVVTRLPFLTSVLYNWDSANFALAIHSYDVTQHHPHPPGYLLYVAVGGLLAGLFADDNLGLATEALLLSAAAVVLTFLFGSQLFGRRVGIGAGLLMLSSVTFWSYGGIALAYPALACFSAWVAWSAYRAGWAHERRAWLPLSVGYAIGSGFRPDLLVFLGPLWLAGVISLDRKRLTYTVVLTFSLVLVWLLPTVALSGGIGSYLAVLRAYSESDVLDRYSSTRNGPAALLTNVRDVVSYSWYALYAMSAPLLGGAFVLARRPRPNRLWVLFLLWLGPLLAFYCVVHIGDPGYVFSFLPALAILASKTLSVVTERLRHSLRVFTAGITLMVAVNTAIYLWYPRLLTAPGVRATDQAASARLRYLRGLPNDGRTLLLSYDSYRHLQYYFPDWRSSLWVDVFAASPATTALSPETRWIVLVDPRLGDQSGPRPAGEPIAEGTMLRLPVRLGQTLTYGSGVLSLN